jgi:hypothetical protein
MKTGGRWKIPRVLFDRRDYELIEIVNDALGRASFERRRYHPFFHPNGIKEMAETKGLRSAYAVAQLLSSLEIGGVDERIHALRSLRSEVIDAAVGPLPKNTARVLLQIMKELVRAHGRPQRQLELAHDFRMAASGRPRVVRRMLKAHHLLEMPEAWNQIAFDDHVHDVNTKGRKSSTHLLMDAWIKGIRRLRIIHYSFIEPRFAAELFAAARILDIDVRIGIEYPARFRGRAVQLIWVPRGFADAQAFMCFLAEPAVMALMQAGQAAARYQQAHVLDLLERFNAVHRLEINRRLEVELPPIDRDAFRAFVGIGQMSRLHLSKFISNELLRALAARLAALRPSLSAAPAEERRRIGAWAQAVNAADLDALVDEYLDPARNPQIRYPERLGEDPEAPALLRLTPPEVLGRLAQLHSGYRVTLNLTDLAVEDVLELLYDCQGMITRLELFNLKDYAAGKTGRIAEISHLMQVMNEGSAIQLKQLIRGIISRLAREPGPETASRIEKLTAILYDIETLKAFYASRPIKARIGSDSTGRSPQFHGMGLAIRETLALRARREIRREKREIFPVRMTAVKTLTFLPTRRLSRFGRAVHRLFGAGPLALLSAGSYREHWLVEPTGTRLEAPGNLVPLGGARRTIDNGLRLEPEADPERPARRWFYLDSRLKNLLKVLAGFIPAFAAFALTKERWVLAYGGAIIWFAITGLRNILQSVLGGGGIRRSPLMNWHDYVSWSRICDSLMFTGFSVPLLDLLVKTLILDRGLGVTVASHPAALYACMALANGIYLASHNIFRGLPKAAVYGNLFRSLLSIPVALALSAGIGGMLAWTGAAPAAVELQAWAAVISKTASDIVAGFIEGLADRNRNILERLRDYKIKFDQLFDIYAQLELLYPDLEAYAVLEHTPHLKRRANAEARDLEKIVMIHALDLLYFWMIQPRARHALRRFVQMLSEDERQILASSQHTLLRQREISQMFIDGILGANFARPLSFYLSRHAQYLEEIKGLIFSERFPEPPPEGPPYPPPPAPLPGVECPARILGQAGRN